jgi:hypothetical protein
MLRYPSKQIKARPWTNRSHALNVCFGFVIGLVEINCRSDDLVRHKFNITRASLYVKKTNKQAKPKKRIHKTDMEIYFFLGLYGACSILAIVCN